MVEEWESRRQPRCTAECPHERPRTAAAAHETAVPHAMRSPFCRISARVKKRDELQPDVASTQDRLSPVHDRKLTTGAAGSLAIVLGSAT